MLTETTAARGRLDADAVPPSERPGDEPAAPLDLNAVVAYNVKAIRLLRGWTQEQVAGRLARFTGHRLPQASISQMERAFYGERRRLFNAQDLYLLSKVFDVPIVYFFLPPAACLDQTVANTGDPLSSVLDSLFGTHASLGAVDRRLVEIADRARDADNSTSTNNAAPDVRPRHLHVSRLSDFDCNVRLREIGNLLQELTDRHRADDRFVPRSGAHR